MSQVPSEERCDLSDLPVSSCGLPCHRNSPDITSSSGSGDVEIERTFTAQYEGDCAVNRRHEIAVGDIIGVLADQPGYACPECVRRIKSA